jgi:hypothetical protein
MADQLKVKEERIDEILDGLVECFTISKRGMRELQHVLDENKLLLEKTIELMEQLEKLLRASLYNKPGKGVNH